MKKTLALLVGSTLMLITVVVAPASVNAMACIGTPPEIGVIESVANSGTSITSQKVMVLQDTFNDSSTPFDSDKMSGIIKTYIDNNYSIPTAYTPGRIYADIQSGKPFMATGDELRALKSMPIQGGDIFLRGSTSSCGGTPFFWLFDAKGTAKSFAAPSSLSGRSEGNYEKIVYGSQTLSVEPETGVECVTTSATSSGEMGNVYETTNTCSIPMTYRNGLQSVTLKPGETKNLSGGTFASVSLLKSTRVDIVKAIPSVFNHYPVSGIELLYTVTFGPVTPPCCKTMPGTSGTTTVMGVNPSLVAPSGPSTKPIPLNTHTCLVLKRNMYIGLSGSDVTTLQDFLIAQNLLAVGKNTGYFGMLTQAAVQKWQSQNGIVSSGTPATTGYGSAGPRTRAAVTNACLHANQLSGVQGQGNNQQVSSMCAIPGYCFVSQFAAGMVPPECQTGKTYSDPSLIKAEQAVFQHAGACQ